MYKFYSKNGTAQFYERGVEIDGTVYGIRTDSDILRIKRSVLNSKFAESEEDFDMNVELWNTLNFGLTDDFTQKGLEETTNTYLRLGLITSTDSLDDVMEAAWHPLYPEV